uniref:Zinc finger Mcm10/DnaG-type domain-containing protein n=1 Tax=Ditylenchus dipsaci TaxID=166011 RepID=A0A915EV56_9BILA
MEEDKLNALVSAFEENDEDSDDDGPLLKISVPSSANSQDMKHPGSSLDQMHSTVSSQSSTCLSLQSSAPPKSQVQSQYGNRDVFDPDFGIRVTNPKIGLSTSNNYCYGMRKIKVSQIRTASITSGEWATMAVIVGKTECRKSSKNNEYCIWRVADLINPQAEPCKVLLFETPADSQAISLKVFKAVQVLEIGYCPDFGHCKGIKPNGETCSNYVNSSKSDYCTYHIRNAAKRLSANRGTFSQLSSVMPKKLRAKETLPEASLGLVTVDRGASKKFEESSPVLKSRPKPYTLGKKNATNSVENLTPKVVSNKPQHPRLVSSSQPAPKSLKEFIKQNINQPKLASRAEIGGLINLASPEKKTMRQLSEEMKIKRAVAILKNSTSINSLTPPTSIAKRKSVIDTDKQAAARGLLGGTFSNSEILAMLDKKSRHENEATEVSWL